VVEAEVEVMERLKMWGSFPLVLPAFFFEMD